MGENMDVLIICVALGIAICVIARLLRASKTVAVALAVVPMAVFLIYLMRIRVSEGGSPGGVLPAWLAVTIGLALSAGPAAVAANLVKGKDRD